MATQWVTWPEGEPGQVLVDLTLGMSVNDLVLLFFGGWNEFRVRFPRRQGLFLKHMSRGCVIIISISTSCPSLLLMQDDLIDSCGYKNYSCSNWSTNPEVGDGGPGSRPCATSIEELKAGVMMLRDFQAPASMGAIVSYLMYVTNLVFYTVQGNLILFAEHLVSLLVTFILELILRHPRLCSLPLTNPLSFLYINLLDFSIKLRSASKSQKLI